MLQGNGRLDHKVKETVKYAHGNEIKHRRIITNKSYLFFYFCLDFSIYILLLIKKKSSLAYILVISYSNHLLIYIVNFSLAF